jgi:transposase
MLSATEVERIMQAYRIAGIDVHKKMLAVVVADVCGGGEFQFERRKFGTTPGELHVLAQWLVQQQVEEVVMESTAQYWRPVWESLEQFWQPAMRSREEMAKMSGTLHLCQAQSNRAPRGRKKDFPDAERLVKRLVAEELTLSFVPEPDLRLLRTVTRRRYQLSRARVMFQNQLESLLEQAHIKLSSLVSDLLGSSARRMLKALSEGVNDPAVVAAMADRRLRATAEQLRDALGSCTDMNPHYRRLIKMALAELQLVETHIQELDQEAMELLHEHQEVVRRIAAVPGFGVDSAMQMIAEVGVAAANFATAKNLVSWVGVCPGDQESAGKSQSTRSPKGNRHMRRLLTQAAHAAVKVKGSIFELTFNRHMRQRKYKPAIWAIAHRLCRLLWLLLSKRVDYEERGPEVSATSKRVRTSRMIRELRKLGYRIEGGPAEPIVQY